jgi:O-antigen biosynthesis protein
LRRQLYDYSKGHVAYHLTTLLCDRDQRAIIRLLGELPLTYLRRLCGQFRPSNTYPLSLLLLELAGNLAGPWALWQSRRRVKREGRSEPYTPTPLRPHPMRSAARADRLGTPVLSGYDKHLSK